MKNLRNKTMEEITTLAIYTYDFLKNNKIFDLNHALY